MKYHGKESAACTASDQRGMHMTNANSSGEVKSWDRTEGRTTMGLIVGKRST